MANLRERLRADIEGAAKAADKFDRKGDGVKAARALGIAEGLQSALSYLEASEAGEPPSATGAWCAHSGEDYTVVLAPHETTDDASIRIFGDDAAALGLRIARALNGMD